MDGIEAGEALLADAARLARHQPPFDVLTWPAALRRKWTRQVELAIGLMKQHEYAHWARHSDQIQTLCVYYWDSFRMSDAIELTRMLEKAADGQTHRDARVRWLHEFAVQLHTMGRLAEAEVLCREGVDASSEPPVMHHMRGHFLHRWSGIHRDRGDLRRSRELLNAAKKDKLRIDDALGREEREIENVSTRWALAVIDAMEGRFSIGINTDRE